MGQSVGKETILICTVYASPHGSVYWSTHGQEVSSTTSKYIPHIYEEGSHQMELSLNILNLDREDFGNYTCHASNTLGKDSESMLLYGKLFLMKMKTTTLTIMMTTMMMVMARRRRKKERSRRRRRTMTRRTTTQTTKARNAKRQRRWQYNNYDDDDVDQLYIGLLSFVDAILHDGVLYLGYKRSQWVDSSIM